MIATEFKTGFNRQKGGTQVFNINPATVISTHSAIAWVVTP